MYIKRECTDVPRNDLEPLGDYAIRIISSYKLLIDDLRNLLQKYKDEAVESHEKIQEKSSLIEELRKKISELEKEIEDSASLEV